MFLIVGDESMAVGTQGLKVAGVIVVMIAVQMMHVQLAYVLRYEAAQFTNLPFVLTIGVMFLVIFPAIPCSSLWAPVTICLSTSPSFF